MYSIQFTTWRDKNQIFFLSTNQVGSTLDMRVLCYSKKVIHRAPRDQCDYHVHFYISKFLGPQWKRYSRFADNTQGNSLLYIYIYIYELGWDKMEAVHQYRLWSSQLSGTPILSMCQQSCVFCNFVECSCCIPDHTTECSIARTVTKYENGAAEVAYSCMDEWMQQCGIRMLIWARVQAIAGNAGAN